MTKTVATHLTIFAGLMFIIFGLKTGLSEHFLEPTGISEIAESSERATGDESFRRADLNALSCGTAWSPYEAAPDGDDSSSDSTKSQLSAFGENRCEVVLAGSGWTAALLTITGAGIWLILLIGVSDRYRGRRSQAEDAEMARLLREKRLESERRRQAIANATD